MFTVDTGRRKRSADTLRKAIAITFAAAGTGAWSSPVLAQNSDEAPAAAPAAAASPALAQAGVSAGRLSGRVSNKLTGDSLQGAIVELVELGRSETTGADGRYLMFGVPAGRYTVRVSYYGFTADEAEVVVASGGMVQQSFALSKRAAAGEPTQLEQVLVVGHQLQDGQLKAINQQRTAKAVETIISAELFGQVNDGNIGNALQKLPGLSVDTDGSTEIPRYVNIRGISTAFNSVQLNGQRLPTTGTGRGDAYGDTGRGFALDDIPADAIATVEIIKAPTPDMDGDGLGGTINLVSRSALDSEGRRFDFKVGANYNALREDTFPEAALSYSDVLGLSGGRRLGLSLTGSFYQTNEGFDNRDLDYNPLRPDALINQGIATQPGLGSSPSIAEVLADTSGERPYVSNGRGPKEALYYHEDTEYNTFIIDRDRIGLMASLDFELDANTRLYARPLYNTETRDNDDRRYHKIMDNDHGDGSSEAYDPNNPDPFFLSRRIVDGNAPGELVRLGADPFRRSTIDFVNENFGRSTLDANGNPRGMINYTGTAQTQDLTLMSLSFGGERLFQRTKLNVDANISQATKDQRGETGRFQRRGFAFEYDRSDRFSARDEQYRVINNDYSYIPDADPFEIVVDPSKVDTLRASTAETRDFDSTQNLYSLKADLERELDFGTMPVNGTWKTGVKLSRLEFDYDETRISYGLPSPSSDLYPLFPWADMLLQNPYSVDQQAMPYYVNAPALRRYLEDPANQASGIVTVSESSSERNSTLSDFTAEENVYAAYLMGTFEAGPMQVIGGVRWEHTQFESTRFIDSEDEGILKGTDKSDYDTLLPSLIVNYEFTENLLLRGALTNSFSRPQIIDLVNVRRVQDLDDPVEIQQGNPDLPPIESRNIDIALEYYLANGYYSIGLFRKDITGFSFEAISIEENVAEFGGRDVQTSTPLATGNARNEGVELASYQRYSFLPYPLDGLYSNLSYTYTISKAEYPGREESELPTRGASKYLFAATLGYEWSRLAASISYRFRSPYIEGLALEDLQGENSFIEDDNFGEAEIVDVNFSLRLFGEISLYANATNLFEEVVSSRQGYLDSPEDIYFNKRRFAVGLKGSF